MTDKDEIIRTAVIRAAEKLFQRWGFNKTTMEDIAREAGKGKSTLYYYFPSKEEIFEAVVTGELEEVIRKAMESTRAIESAHGKIKQYMVTVLLELRNSASAYSIVRSEIRRNQAILDPLRNKFVDRERQFIRELLLYGESRNEFTFHDEPERESAVTAVIGIIHALELYFLIEKDDMELLSSVAKLMAHGI